MELFLDTADIESIKPWLNSGMIDGITTNPSIIAKSGRNFYEVIAELCALIKKPVSAEVTETTHEAMLKQAKELRAISKHVVIKLPITLEGLKTCYQLSKDHIPTNLTLCFCENQALMAAKAGATYVSPFIGRLEDNGQKGLKLIDRIRTTYDNYNFPTKILAASIRGTEHVQKVSYLGADVATIPPSLLDEMVYHPLTNKGLEKFLNDWRQSQS